MRLTDARTVRLPVNGVLTVRSNKTGKAMEFEVAQSPTLTEVVQRREKIKAHSVMLLTTKRGRQVTAAMLWLRWDRARNLAAEKASQEGHTELAAAIRAMYLRDMRKRAADLSETVEDASKLLQHDSVAITRKHYTQKPQRLRAVR